ncbi:MAG: diguanylate cyclase [Desulfocapsa sp.]|nr:diguanylate cyclase [Desulfocapsa sp.]
MTLPDNLKILLAGNGRRFNKSLQELLHLHGYEPHPAFTDQEAVILLEKHSFGLIILDLRMIENYGQKMMEQLKSKQGLSKLIMLSHDAIFDKAVWALRQGADDFFKTPYSPDKLLLSIQKQLRHGKTNEKNKGDLKHLQRVDSLHRYMISNSPDIIYLLNRDGKFSFFNKQVEMLLGFSRKELLGRHYSKLIHPGDLEKARYVFFERRTGKRAAKNVELRLLLKNNTIQHRSLKQTDIDVELYSTGVYKKCPKSNEKIFLGTYGVVRDISQRKISERQFHHQLYHDTLTNLPNRSLFHDRLRLALSQARRNKTSLAVMFLDIDGFKGINDSFGHACGDAFLQTFGVRLRSCLRESDTLARMGGDEFAILIPRITSRKDIENIAKKIVDEFKIPFKMDHSEVLVGVSIGIAVSPEDSDSGDELIQKADWAMYYVKHNGKNAFVHYKDSIHQLDTQSHLNNSEKRR